MKWRPKDTAPKDGTQFMVWDPANGLITRVSWEEGGWISHCEMWSGNFTYWMPRPRGPQ